MINPPLETAANPMPTFFLSHGGGPWPYMHGPVREHHALLEQALTARIAHPREQHLIPLMVIAGAAGNDPAIAVYGEKFFGHLASSSFRFGTDRSPSGFDPLG